MQVATSKARSIGSLTVDTTRYVYRTVEVRSRHGVSSRVRGNNAWLESFMARYDEIVLKPQFFRRVYECSLPGLLHVHALRSLRGLGERKELKGGLISELPIGSI